jgi:Ca2+-binding EF-hand superfamily protein
MDLDRDGLIDKREFNMAARPVFVFGMLDADGDGRITRKEYIACFNILDINGDGFITREELRKVLKSEDGLNIPDREIDKLIKEVDFNHDEKIDYNEFLTMMRRDLKGEETEKAIRQATVGAAGSKEALLK